MAKRTRIDGAHGDKGIELTLALTNRRDLAGNRALPYQCSRSSVGFAHAIEWGRFGRGAQPPSELKEVTL